MFRTEFERHGRSWARTYADKDGLNFTRDGDFDTLEEARGRIAAIKSRGRDSRTNFRIVEFEPGVPAVPEKVVAIHPAQEPKKFRIHVLDTRGRSMGVSGHLPFAQDFDSLDAALQQVEAEFSKSVKPTGMCANRRDYCVFETPYNIRHNISEPNEVEVLVRVKVPRGTLIRCGVPFVHFNDNQSVFTGAAILSVEEVKP